MKRNKSLLTFFLAPVVSISYLKVLFLPYGKDGVDLGGKDKSVENPPLDSGVSNITKVQGRIFSWDFVSNDLFASSFEEVLKSEAN